MCITVSHHSGARRPARGDLGGDLRAAIDDVDLLAEVTTTLTELITALGTTATERTVVVHDDCVEIVVAGGGRMQHRVVEHVADEVSSKRMACTAA